MDYNDLESLEQLQTLGENTGGYGALMALGFGMMAAVFVLALALYVYQAIMLYKIAKKTSTEPAWLSWIPIANLYLMVMIARRPWWWFLIFFASFIPVIGPIVTAVLFVIIWMDISQALGKDKWLGILSIIPIANLVLVGYLALSKTAVATFPQASSPVPPQNPTV